MPKVTTSGLDTSAGKQGVVPVEKGRYRLKIKSITGKDSNKSPCTTYCARFTVEAGPKQKDGKAPKGRPIAVYINVLHPEHPSYNTIGVDELRSLLDAAGVKISKGGSWNSDSAVDQVIEADLDTKEEEYQGKKQKKQVAYMFYSVSEDSNGEDEDE